MPETMTCAASFIAEGPPSASSPAMLTHDTEARSRLVRGSVFKTDGGHLVVASAGSIPVRFRHPLASALSADGKPGPVWGHAGEIVERVEAPEPSTRPRSMKPSDEVDREQTCSASEEVAHSL